MARIGGNDALDGADTQDPVDADTAEEELRRLRDDARSDPMEDQTEAVSSEQAQRELEEAQQRQRASRNRSQPVGGGEDQSQPAEQADAGTDASESAEANLTPEQSRTVDRLERNVGGAVREAEESARGFTPEEQRQVDRLERNVGGAVAEAEGAARPGPISRRERFEQQLERDIGGAVREAERAAAPRTRTIPSERVEQRVNQTLGAAIAGAEQSAGQDEEQFGDIDWSFGVGGPDDEVENALEGASSDIQQAGREFASAIFDEGGVGSESAGEEVLTALGRPELGARYEENLRGLGRGIAQSPFLLGDLPGLADTALEGVEYGQFATTQSLPKTISQSEERGVETLSNLRREVGENPAEFIGLAVGSLAGSFGIIRGATRVSPRAGLATRYAIQPGEELAGSLGYRATRATAGTRAAERFFPNREPLIFSEEAAIRTGRRVGGRLRTEAAALRARVSDIEGVNIRTRGVGAGLVPPRIELETATETSETTPITAEDIADPRPAGRRPSRPFERERIRRQRQFEQTRLSEPRGGGETRSLGYRSAETETRGIFGFDTETELESRESELAGEVETESITRTELAQQSLLDSDALEAGGLELAQDVASADLEIGRSRFTQDFDLGQDVRTDVETELDLEQEFEFETETELVSDIEQEFENELEVETEFENELEIETEPVRVEGDEGDDEEPFLDFFGSSLLVDRTLRNPFTGE